MVRQEIGSTVVTTSDRAAEPVGIGVAGLTARYDAELVLRGVDLDVRGGEILALLGPSGCGKTTLLRCIAGLERPTSGTIMIGERDVTAGRGVPAEKRRVGMVFQDGALFPHRSALDNVSYGIRRGPGRRDRALAALRLVGLEDKAARMPGALSGGEQQRVALARALAPGPSAVLLDEPFSSLDAALRVQLRDEVRRLLTGVGVTAILVTHDQQEAMSFGDRVAVMRFGSIQQLGTPEDVYARPATPWVAGFVGEAVVLPAELDGTTARTALGQVRTRPSTAQRGTVMLRPEQILISPGGRMQVETVQYFGANTRYEVRVPGARSTVVSRCSGPPAHRLGDRVSVRVADGLVHSWPSSLDDQDRQETTNVETIPLE
jgi:iron(III) transport system ATP-binding protein